MVIFSVVKNVIGAIGALLTIGGIFGWFPVFLRDDIENRILAGLIVAACLVTGAVILYVYRSMETSPKPFHLFLVGLLTFIASIAGAVFLTVLLLKPFFELVVLEQPVAALLGFEIHSRPAEPGKYVVVRRGQIVRDATQLEVDVHLATLKWGFIVMASALWLTLVAGAVKGYLLMKAFWPWRQTRADAVALIDSLYVSKTHIGSSELRSSVDRTSFAYKAGRAVSRLLSGFWKA